MRTTISKHYEKNNFKHLLKQEHTVGEKPQVQSRIHRKIAKSEVQARKNQKKIIQHPYVKETLDAIEHDIKQEVLYGLYVKPDLKKDSEIIRNMLGVFVKYFEMYRELQFYMQDYMHLLEFCQRESDRNKIAKELKTTLEQRRAVKQVLSSLLPAPATEALYQRNYIDTKAIYTYVKRFHEVQNFLVAVDKQRIVDSEFIESKTQYLKNTFDMWFKNSYFKLNTVRFYTLRSTNDRNRQITYDIRERLDLFNFEKKFENFYTFDDLAKKKKKY